MNFAPSSVLKVKNTSFHPELRQVSRGLHCVTSSGCYW